MLSWIEKCKLLRRDAESHCRPDSNLNQEFVFTKNLIMPKIQNLLGQLVSVALLSIASFGLMGCKPNPEANTGSQAIRVKGKIGVVVTSKSDPWISRQLEVISAAKFFPGGVIVLEATNTNVASSAMSTLKSQGCTFVILLGQEDLFNGKLLAEAASKAGIKAIALHWRLPGKDGKMPEIPFVGIHDNQVGDSLAQTALKTEESKTAKFIFIGPIGRHPEFYERADATLSSKVNTKNAVRCETELGKPLAYYKGPVLKALKGQSVKENWVVIGYDDATALGAAKALTDAGAKKVLAYGIGGSTPVIDAWKSNANYALDGSVLISPYPEVLALAKTLSKWESAGSTPSKTQIGGAVIQKNNYEKLMKSMLQPSVTDLS